MCVKQSTQKQSRRGSGLLHVICVERLMMNSASTGPVNNQQDHSQSLSSAITAMAVCLTSTVTSQLQPLLYFFLNSSPVIKVGKLNTPNVLCFHLVVTVTRKHWEVVNEIPSCHQSLADKGGIVVVCGGVPTEVGAGGFVCCFSDPGSDSGSLFRGTLEKL